jgi:hypothetical protein
MFGAKKIKGQTITTAKIKPSRAAIQQSIARAWQTQIVFNIFQLKDQRKLTFFAKKNEGKQSTLVPAMWQDARIVTPCGSH